VVVEKGVKLLMVEGNLVLVTGDVAMVLLIDVVEMVLVTGVVAMVLLTGVVAMVLNVTGLVAMVVKSGVVIMVVETGAVVVLMAVVGHAVVNEARVVPRAEVPLLPALAHGPRGQKSPAPMQISAQPRKVSWGPQPSRPVRSLRQDSV
jgi:hypothetical protein